MKKLTPQETMKAQVLDLEIKARYWKAQFEIRHFTLQAEKIQEEYDNYLKETKIKNEELQKEFDKELERIKEMPDVEVS